MNTSEMADTSSSVARQLDRDRPDVFLMTNTLEAGGGERQFAALAGG